MAAGILLCTCVFTPKHALSFPGTILCRQLHQIFFPGPIACRQLYKRRFIGSIACKQLYKISFIGSIICGILPSYRFTHTVPCKEVRTITLRRFPAKKGLLVVLNSFFHAPYSQFAIKNVLKVCFFSFDS